MNNKVEYIVLGDTVYLQVDTDTTNIDMTAILNYVASCKASETCEVRIAGKINASIKVECDVATLIRKANGIVTRAKKESE